MNRTTYVALVDDHKVLRSGLAVLINTFDGYRVMFEADHGKDFIRRLKPAHPPDIVLLDITMPVMNGYETADWLRINLPNSKVLVLSILENDASIIRMLRSGARGYIFKDASANELHMALDAVRDTGLYTNNAVNSRMWNYMNNQETSNDPAVSVLSHLTERELTFLRHVCTELTYKEIADEMFVSPRTIDGYRDTLFEKLGVNSRVGLAMFAIKYGMVCL